MDLGSTQWTGVSTPSWLMDGGQGGVHRSCPPRDDFIGDRRSAATGCLPAQDSDSWPRFTITLYRNVVRQMKLCAKDESRAQTACCELAHYAFIQCLWCVLLLSWGSSHAALLLSNQDRVLTPEDDLVGAVKGSGGLSCKKCKFVMRERRTSIRKEHWPEQLYYCQRFTLHFIPHCHS